MSSSERNDFTRDITTSIMVYTLYPTKLEREHVAFLVIKKYPFLADKLGSGIVSTTIYLSTIYLSTLHTRYQSLLTKIPLNNETSTDPDLSRYCTLLVEKPT